MSDPAKPSPGRSISRAQSFRHAFDGWGYVLRTQPNARIHGAFSLIAIVVGLWVGIDSLQWALIVLAMGGVWVAELLNTSLEAVVDIASPSIQPLARIAKDVAAAAGLAGAATAVVIGLLVLGPPSLAKITGVVIPLMPH